MIPAHNVPHLRRFFKGFKAGKCGRDADTQGKRVLASLFGVSGGATRVYRLLHHTKIEGVKKDATK